MEINKIHNLHCYEAENILDNNSIDCIITSPPYWNLRDYGVDGQFGLEKTVEQYIENLVQFFDILYCKLKDTGTCFVNLGDTYNGSKVFATHTKPSQKLYQNKSLLMLPYLFAMRMCEKWTLRSVIIWHKRSAFRKVQRIDLRLILSRYFSFQKSPMATILSNNLNLIKLNLK
jgi:site-specific DNA-methyltransferase (adenine-specific)